MEIALIPKKEKEKGLPRFVTFQGPKLELTLVSKMGILLIVVGLVAGAGLYAWRAQLKKQLSGISEELKTTIGQRDLSLEGRLKNLNAVLDVFKGVLDTHRYWSEVFKMLEARTLNAVKFVSFDGDDAAAVMTLNGSASSYQTMAQQIKVLQETPQIISVTVSDIDVSEQGRVAFTLKIDFNRELIMRR